MIETVSKPKPVSPRQHTGLSLSDYYPKDTVYFYSFPAGEDSKFYNQVPTYDEELVSGRPLVCAGESIKIVTFAAAADTYILRTLSKNLSLVDPSNIITLPQNISANIKGSKRNRLVKEALGEYLEDGKLVMAQPFLDSTLDKKFKIKPELSVTLSDKSNRHLYIPDSYIPQQYAVFASGTDFYSQAIDFPLPCVIKVASSSSGDGVIICNTNLDIANAKQAFRNIRANILVEECIESIHNLCIQFGISHDAAVEPTIIGFNEQIISKQGGFLGGIVNLKKTIPQLPVISRVLLQEVLPQIRRLGWYGIGGIDVLITKDGKFYFIDPNLRLTATYAYIYLAKMKEITRPLLSFTGIFCGTKSDFEKQIMPMVEDEQAMLRVVSLTLHRGTFRFNAAIEFNSVKDLKLKVRTLLDKGVQSTVLNNVMQPDFEYQLA